MADKILNTRLRLKYDTWANWTAQNPVLLKGEVGIVYIPEQTNEAGKVTQKPATVFKVGDGTTPFNGLEFASALAADVYGWAKEEKKPNYLAKEIGIEDPNSYFAGEDVEAVLTEIWNEVVKMNGGSGSTGSIAQQIASGIEALGSATVTADGKYVTGVKVENGKLVITEKDLPEYAAKSLETTVSTLKDDFDDHVETVAEYGTRISNAETAITNIKTGTNINDFGTVESALSNRYTKSEVDNKFVEKLADYTSTAIQTEIDAEQDRRLGVIESDYVKDADISNFETKENVKKVADGLAEYITSNDKALAEVKVTAEAATTVDEVDTQIDNKITALKLNETYEAIGAEGRAKAYAEGLITNANLDQYTTEQEVKDIVDTVIAGAVEGDTITGLANLVEYINTHGGEAAEMASAIDVLEGKVDTLEKTPAAGIKATDIEAWNGEIGAKALAETKTTTAEVKTQIEAYGYATTGYADGKASEAQAAAEATAAEALTEAKIAISAEIDADVKVVADDLSAYKTNNDKRVSDAEALIATKANDADLKAVAKSGSAYDLIESNKDLNKTADGDVEVDCFIFYGGSATELVKNHNA